MKFLKMVESWKGTLAIYAGVFFLIFAPYLIDGQMLAQNADTHLTNYPLMTLFVERFGSGDFLWNDLNFHGFPMGLGFPFQYHLPVLFLAAFLPAIAVLNWAVYLTVVAASLLFCSLLRRYEISSSGSLLAGLAYGVSTWYWMFDLTILSTLLLLPLLIICVERSEERWMFWSLLGGLVVGYAWLTLHFQFVVILLFAGGAVAVARLLQRKRTVLQSYCIMGCIGTVIGLLRLLPTLAYGALSERSAMTLADATTGGTIGMAYPLRFLFPGLRIPLMTGFGSGFDPYIGPMLLFFAITAAILAFQRPLVRFLLIVIGIILLLTIPYSPLYALLFQVPPFGMLRYPTRWLLLVNIAVAALVGFGFDVSIKRSCHRLRQRVAMVFLWIGGVVLLGSLSVSALVVAPDGLRQLCVGFLLEKFPHHTAQSFVTTVDSVYGISQFHSIAALALVVTGLYLRSIQKKKLNKLETTRLVTVSIGLFLLVFIPRSYQLGVDASIYYHMPDTMQYVQGVGGTYFSPLPESVVQEKLQAVHGNVDRTEVRSVLRSLGLASYNLYDGIESADLYDRIASKRMARLLAAIGSQRPSVTSDREIASRGESVNQKLSTIGMHRYVFDILNIQHVISGWPLQKLGFKKAFTEDASSYGIPVSVFHNETARPFAYFAKEVVYQEVDADAAEAFILGESWPSDRTLIECDGCSGERTHTADGSIDVLIREPRYTVIKAEVEEFQWLVISQNFLPGWRLVVNGVESTPALAHGTFVAISVGEGVHEIDLQFSFGKLLEDSVASIFYGRGSIWGGK